MKKSIARDLWGFLADKRLLGQFDGRVLHAGRNTVSGFHSWVDGKPTLGIVRLIDPVTELTLHFAITAWRSPDEYYVALFSGNKTSVYGELWKCVRREGGDALKWQYSPSKRDGHNAERKEYFAKHYGGLEVLIELPQGAQDAEEFVRDCFIFAQNRIRADELSGTPPVSRDTFEEGRTLERRHKQKERSADLVRNAKLEFKNKHGRLYCEVCGFDFKEAYGKLGEGFIEAHHVMPVSELKESTLVRIDDLAMVCANCHRMIHRKRPWLSHTELKTILIGTGRSRK